MNPPGNFVWDAKDDGRADPPLRRAVREGRDLQQRGPTTWPPRCERDSRGPPGPLVVPADQEGQRPRRVLLRSHGNDVGGGADLGADDARLVARGGRRRRERVLVPVAARRPGLPGVVRLGRDGRHGASSDARARARHFASGGERGSILGNPARTSTGAAGSLADAWPRQSGRQASTAGCGRRTSRRSLIGGELDFATPPQGATKELLPLPAERPPGRAARVRTLDGRSGRRSPKAGSRLINTFLDSGTGGRLALRAPSTSTSRPSVTQTALGKGFAGAMVGLALLAVLSLLWMARRVRKRGGFGRKASAVLRSVYPIVLGLGGWFLGVLVVITTMPTVPLDQRAARRPSRWALPIGLGDLPAPGCTATGRPRRRPRASRRRRQARSPAPGSGFNAVAGLLALITGDRRGGRRGATCPCSCSTSRGTGSAATAPRRPARATRWRRARRPADAVSRRRAGSRPGASCRRRPGSRPRASRPAPRPGRPGPGARSRRPGRRRRRRRPTPRHDPVARVDPDAHRRRLRRTSSRSSAPRQSGSTRPPRRAPAAARRGRPSISTGSGARPRARGRRCAGRGR